MKNKLFAAALSAILLSGTLSTVSPAAEEKELTKITLNEVAHSIFYAPQYAAIELGYFEEEGIELELVTGFGAI